MALLSDDPRITTPDDLTRFHDRHWLLLLAHAPSDVIEALDRLVAQAGGGDFAATLEQYRGLFAHAADTRPPPSGHVNALLHAAGRLRGSLTDAEWEGVSRAIEQFAAGAASLARPLRLLRRHAARHGHTWLLEQVYPAPGSAILM